MKRWLIPIGSAKPSGSGKAHLMESRSDSRDQVRTECGMMVTPFFAEQIKRRTPKCRRCEKRIAK